MRVCGADPFAVLEGLEHPAPTAPQARPGLSQGALYGPPAPAAGQGGLLGDLGPTSQPGWHDGAQHANAAQPDTFGMDPLDGLLGGVQPGLGGAAVSAGAAMPAAYGAGPFQEACLAHCDD